jgi:hypothetical protein
MTKIFRQVLILLAITCLALAFNRKHQPEHTSDTNHTFFVNILNEVRHKQQNTHISMPLCQDTHLAVTFDKFLKVPKKGPYRLQLLKEFLCIKYFQYFEMITYLSIDELRQLLKDFKILKNEPLIPRHGTDRCNLKTLALASVSQFQEVCPWTMEMVQRSDIYPFEVTMAMCSCENCLGRTKFDSDIFQLSKCLPTYQLRPVLVYYLIAFL